MCHGDIVTADEAFLVLQEQWERRALLGFLSFKIFFKHKNLHNTPKEREKKNEKA